MHFISKCIHLELNYWCISFLSSEFQDSGPHHAATVDRLRPGARYLYLQPPAAGLCNWMQIFIWAPVSCHVAFIHLPVVLNFHSEQAVFWIRTAARVQSEQCISVVPAYVPMLAFQFFNIIIVKRRKRQATKKNVLCLWLSFRMLPTKTDRSPAFSAHAPAPAACPLSDPGKCVLCGLMRPRARG